MSSIDVAREAVRNAQEKHDQAHALSVTSYDYDRRFRRLLREASEAYRVASDALLYTRRTDLANRYRRRADRLDKLLERRQRIYRRFRARGMPASEAYERANHHTWFTVLSQVHGDVGGDCDDAGFLVRGARRRDAYALHWIHTEPEDQYVIFRIPLEREPIPDWVNVQAVGEVVGMRPTLLRREWSSRNALSRANARAIAIAYYGAENFDGYPTRHNRDDMRLMYQRRFARC